MELARISQFCMRYPKLEPRISTADMTQEVARRQSRYLACGSTQLRRKFTTDWIAPTFPKRILVHQNARSRPRKSGSRQNAGPSQPSHDLNLDLGPQLTHSRQPSSVDEHLGARHISVLSSSFIGPGC